MNRHDFEIGLAHLILYSTLVGNLNVPNDHICPDGYRLGEFSLLIREELVLAIDRISRLETIGFSLDKGLQDWESMYRLAANYVRRYGSLPNRDYKTEEDILLGTWIWRQKDRIDYLTEDQRRKLARIGITD